MGMGFIKLQFHLINQCIYICECMFEQFAIWVFCRSLGLNFTEFFCCSIHPMGWEEREFILHIFKHRPSGLFVFPTAESATKSLLTEN